MSSLRCVIFEILKPKFDVLFVFFVFFFHDKTTTSSVNISITTNCKELILGLFYRTDLELYESYLVCLLLVNNIE